MNYLKHLDKPHLGILLLRIVVGAIFLYAGYQKLTDMPQTIQFFEMIGFSAFWAWVTALTELIGGFLIITGYAMKIAGFLLAVTMIVAAYTIAPQAGFMCALAPVLLATISLYFVTSGCGKYSVCSMAHEKKCDPCKTNGKCNCQH
jgi:putative oxidoreductase